MPTEAIDVPSLEGFYAEGLITEVVGRLKSGKEATVYCCRAHPATGAALLAAKVYRPLAHRAFKNDAVYQQGRVILDARTRRAYRKKTRRGRTAQFGLWTSHEFETLRALHAAGADVPRPLARSGPAILMDYVGDGSGPAPVLDGVHLSSDEAAVLFGQVMRNVELFLACNVIHADLSGFNILYRPGRVTIIDFPQAVDPRFNPSALPLLTRDIHNVCAYFGRYGVEADPQRLAKHLWARFLRAEL